MADERIPDDPPSEQPPEEEEKITRIHDKYFYGVFPIPVTPPACCAPTCRLR